MTAAQELAYMSIEELAGKIQRRDVSPVEVTQAMLDRVEQLEPQIHAFNTVFKDEVVKAARAAESEIQRGAYRGPLHGVPIGIKDIYECGPTTCGSQSLEHYVAEKDCTSVAKLKEAGALVLGKTATMSLPMVFPPNSPITSQPIIPGTLSMMPAGRAAAPQLLPRLVWPTPVWDRVRAVQSAGRRSAAALSDSRRPMGGSVERACIRSRGASTIPARSLEP